MRLLTPVKKSHLVRNGLAFLALLLSFTVGAASLVWTSPVAPLAVGGLIALIALGIVLLQRSERAIFFIVFIFWFPYVPTLYPLSSQSPGELYDLVLGIALLAWGLRQLERPKPVIWGPTALLIVALILWAALSITWANNLVLGRQELVQWVLVFLTLFLIVNEIDTAAKLDGFMQALALSGGLLVLSGLATVLFTGYQYGTRLQVLGINENLYGLFLITAMPGVLWPAFRSTGRKRSTNVMLANIYILISGVLILLSGSRGTTLSLAVILAAFWLWKSTRKWAWLGLFSLIILMISAPFLFSTILKRLVDTQEPGLGGRPVLWQASLLLINDLPWSGAGVGNGAIALKPYIRSLTDAYGYRNDLPSHNPILEVGIDLGIPGILLYLGMIASALYQFTRSYIQLSRAKNFVMRPYFALMSCIFLGYITSWLKGGGLSSQLSYFLMLSLLIIPSCINRDEITRFVSSEDEVQNE
jgi:putative inorganic carbon (hco3(-)) transporter